MKQKIKITAEQIRKAIKADLILQSQDVSSGIFAPFPDSIEIEIEVDVPEIGNRISTPFEKRVDNIELEHNHRITELEKRVAALEDK